MSGKIHDSLTVLAACLCVEASDDGETPLCFCDIIPGDQVVHDYGFDDCDRGDGMAWVRLVTAYPAVNVGQIDERPGNCAAQTGLDIEVGILRPYSIEEQLTAEVANDAVEGQYADLARLKRTILCCGAFGTKEIKLGPYTPVGPMGGVYGGVMLFSAVV